MRSLVITLMLLFATHLASAHGLLLDAESDGRTVTGTAYYSNGEEAANEAISLHELVGENEAPKTGLTDAEGNFEFPVTEGRRYRIVVHGEEGHSVELELVAKASAKPMLIENDAAAEEASWFPPAWMLLGCALLLSLVPAMVWTRPTSVDG